MYKIKLFSPLKKFINQRNVFSYNNYIIEVHGSALFVYDFAQYLDFVICFVCGMGSRQTPPTKKKQQQHLRGSSGGWRGKQ